MTVTWEIITNFSYKLPSDESFQVFLTNYYQRNHSKHYLVTITRESFETSLLNYYTLQNIHVQAITWEMFTNYYQRIISNNTYKVLSEKPLKIFATNHYERNHCKQYLRNIIRESFKTILTNYFQGNHCKLCSQKFIRELST